MEKLSRMEKYKELRMEIDSDAAAAGKPSINSVELQKQLRSLNEPQDDIGDELSDKIKNKDKKKKDKSKKGDKKKDKNKKKKDKKSDKKNSSKKKKKKKEKSKKADKDYRSKNIAKEEAFDE